jgi:hypothetical protein
MKLSGWIVTLSVLFLLGRSLGAAPKETVVVVNRPTIVAFFPSETESELSKEPDTNEALADFQYYAGIVRPQLHDVGVDFEEVYASSFRVKCGAKTTTFHSGKIGIGYYFVATGKSPRVQYGVMTDSDILHIASEYFRLASK